MNDTTLNAILASPVWASETLLAQAWQNGDLSPTETAMAEALATSTSPLPAWAQVPTGFLAGTRRFAQPMDFIFQAAPVKPFKPLFVTASPASLPRTEPAGGTDFGSPAAIQNFNKEVLAHLRKVEGQLRQDPNNFFLAFAWIALWRHLNTNAPVKNDPFLKWVVTFLFKKRYEQMKIPGASLGLEVANKIYVPLLADSRWKEMYSAFESFFSSQGVDGFTATEKTLIGRIGAYAVGDLQTKITVIEESLATETLPAYSKEMAELFHFVASLYMKAALHQRGIDFFERMSRVPSEDNGTKTMIQNLIGFLSLQMKDFVRSEAAYRQALQLGENMESRIHLAVCLVRQAKNITGDQNKRESLYREAGDLFEKSLADPTYIQFIHHEDDYREPFIAVMIWKERFDLALPALKEQHRRKLKDPKPVFLMAYCYQKLGNYQKALNLIEELVQKRSEQIIADDHLWRATLELLEKIKKQIGGTGQGEMRLQILALRYELESSPIANLMNYAAALWETRQREKAIALVEARIRREAKDFNALKPLLETWIQAALSNQDKPSIRMLLQLILEQDPQNTVALDAQRELNPDASGHGTKNGTRPRTPPRPVIKADRHDVFDGVTKALKTARENKAGAIQILKALLTLPGLSDQQKGYISATLDKLSK